MLLYWYEIREPYENQQRLNMSLRTPLKCRKCKYGLIKITQEPFKVFWLCNLYLFDVDNRDYTEVVQDCKEGESWAIVLLLKLFLDFLKGSFAGKKYQIALLSPVLETLLFTSVVWLFSLMLGILRIIFLFLKTLSIALLTAHYFTPLYMDKKDTL